MIGTPSPARQSEPDPERQQQRVAAEPVGAIGGLPDEATIAIRKWEKRRGQYTPIIAMTASVMKGDRERCMEAGMDGYISKPIDATQLSMTLNKFSPAHSADQADKEAQRAATGTLDVFDLDVALKQIPGGIESFKELVQIFRHECPKLLHEIHDGLAAMDALQVERGAHSLMGTAGVLSAKRVAAAAHRIEQLGRNQDLDNADDAMADLEVECERLQEAITAICDPVTS